MTSIENSPPPLPFAHGRFGSLFFSAFPAVRCVSVSARLTTFVLYLTFCFFFSPIIRQNFPRPTIVTLLRSYLLLFVIRFVSSSYTVFGSTVSHPDADIFSRLERWRAKIHFGVSCALPRRHSSLTPRRRHQLRCYTSYNIIDSRGTRRPTRGVARPAAAAGTAATSGAAYPRRFSDLGTCTRCRRGQSSNNPASLPR